jgi:hypothetical protein
MTSSLQSSLQRLARRGGADKATCDHYDYPVWVSVVGRKQRARCLGCEKVGPVVYEGPLAARRALRANVAHAG